MKHSKRKKWKDLEGEGKKERNGEGGREGVELSLSPSL